MTSPIHNLVNKLSKFQWKIIDNTIIKSLLEKISDEDISDSKLYKVTHSIKNKWYLVSIKKNTFLVTSPNTNQDEEDIIMNHYRDQLKKHCQKYIQWTWYIWWLKALELHLNNYDIADTIEIINNHKNALEVIMFDKTVNYKTYTHQKKNIFSVLKKLLQNYKIGKTAFQIANIELAMLESLHSTWKTQATLTNEYIKKIIKKHKKTLKIENFALMLSNNKHHVGINKLYQISKGIDPDFAEKLYALIKKYSFIIKASK